MAIAMLAFGFAIGIYDDVYAQARSDTSGVVAGQAKSGEQAGSSLCVFSAVIRL
jgi:hypothetical protein